MVVRYMVIRYHKNCQGHKGFVNFVFLAAHTI